MSVCMTCGGSGQVLKYDKSNKIIGTKTCTACGGTGFVPKPKPLPAKKKKPR